MSHDPNDLSPMFRIDVSQTASETHLPRQQESEESNGEIANLLHQLVLAQDRQNELMEELIEQNSAAQRQRSNELTQWKEANPLLARRCRAAAEALSQVQTEFLHNLTVEINDNFESMMDGEFVLNEFVDRFGPRLAHLNGVLQLLSQLSSQTPAPNDHF